MRAPNVLMKAFDEQAVPTGRVVELTVDDPSGAGEGMSLDFTRRQDVDHFPVPRS